MESKELIQSCLHAKAWSFICSRLENIWGGGGVRMTAPLGYFVTVNSLVVRGLMFIYLLDLKWTFSVYKRLW